MARTSRPASSSRRSGCPISSSLELLGDRWSLLIVRDLLRGFSRYGEFAGSPERIPTNILADRLQRLEDAGIIESTPYQDNPKRYAYALTGKGQDLKPVLAALGRWGLRHIPKTQTDRSLETMLRADA